LSQLQRVARSLQKSIEFCRQTLRFELAEKWIAETAPLGAVTDELC
jgi:hypothetical protein